jgi:membrane dipeptidase
MSDDTKRGFMRRSIVALAVLLSAGPAFAQEEVSAADRLAHEQMLTLDSHLDTPAVLGRQGWTFGDYHQVGWDRSEVDLPRMEQGGLDGGFFVIFTEQGPLTAQGYASARDRALLRAAAIQRMVAAYPDKMAFARTADDAARIAATGKRIVYQSIENSYPLGTDVTLLQSFFALGVRMAGPVHFKNNQFADSASEKPRWHGLSRLGREWVVEMNRLGMIVDASHASDDVFDQLLLLSKTPIILSHSGPKAIYDHPRNLDDARMRKLAAAGGVMQINSVYLTKSDDNKEREAQLGQQEHWATLAAEKRRDLLAQMAALDASDPPKRATFDIFMASLLHAIEVMGVDHVGIGADWDGGGGVIGMEDITALPRITARLRKAGYSDSDIEKIWSGNVLRLLRQAEDYAASQRTAG